MLEKRKEFIRGQLDLIDARMKQVNENSTSIEQQLFAMLQEVLYRLQEYHQRKLNILVGESLEYGRQMEEMAWAESFLRYTLSLCHTHAPLSLNHANVCCVLCADVQLPAE